MGFFSDFLTWLKGRNLCPSLMNDKQELEKLGEYEEENGGIGTYLHSVLVIWDDASGEQSGIEIAVTYTLISTKKEEIFVNRSSGRGITDRLEYQGFTFSSGTMYNYDTNDSFQVASINSARTSGDLETVSGITYEIAAFGVPADPAKLLEENKAVRYKETITAV